MEDVRWIRQIAAIRARLSAIESMLRGRFGCCSGRNPRWLPSLPVGVDRVLPCLGSSLRQKDGAPPSAEFQLQKMKLGTLGLSSSIGTLWRSATSHFPSLIHSSYKLQVQIHHTRLHIGKTPSTNNSIYFLPLWPLRPLLVLLSLDYPQPAKVSPSSINIHVLNLDDAGPIP